MNRQEKICLLGKGNSTKSKKACLKLKNHLAQTYNVEICLSQYPEHHIQLAKEQAIDCDHLIVVGGDGTINEIVNGLMTISQ